MDIPWPKRGNKAFASSADGKFFHLPSSQFWHLPQHSEAFKLAAEMIINSHENAPRSPHHDELSFPVAYLYRHCLELKLKKITMIGIHLNILQRSDKILDLLNKKHGLAKLWTKAKAVINERWAGAEQESPKAVEAVINEFHQADPSGQAFRYCTDSNGKRFRHERLPDHISLATLRETMDAVCTFLDACYDGLDDSLQAMSGNYDGP
jgi:hypothetical protein